MKKNLWTSFHYKTELAFWLLMLGALVTVLIYLKLLEP